jgi:16S rRNA (guanine527-N7)-methyltransferase
MSLQSQLQAGLDALRVSWTDAQIEQSLAYIGLIGRWNRIDNLTAITDPQQMVVHHLLDSLSIHPFLGAAVRVLDVGSGAGLPGIPLAIFNPESRFTLLDAAAKRVRFLHHARARLGLGNIDPQQGRVASFGAGDGYDVIVSRAFSSIGEFVSQSAHLLAPSGRLLAMKGKLPQDELGDLPDEFKYTVSPLQVPGLQAQRHLISITAGS